MTKRKVLKPHRKGIISEDIIRKAVKSVGEMNRYKVKFSLSDRYYYFRLIIRAIYNSL